MLKVIDEQTFRTTLGETPDLYTRVVFEDGTVEWLTRFGIAHEGFQKPLEEKYTEWLNNK